MSSTNLDRSLDEIIATKHTSKPRGGRRGGRNSTGGVQKRVSSNTTRTTTGRPAVPTKPAAVVPNKFGVSKILVSNLPHDITEQQIKEYFSKSVGPIKSVQLVYGPNGTSRGIATVIFNKSLDGQIACNKYNGVSVDGRAMRVELIAEAPALPTFAERIGQPNQPRNQPRAAKKVGPKNAATELAKNTQQNGTRGAKEGGRRGGRGGRGGRGRPTRKTVQELDAEMDDYYEKPGAVTGATAAAPTNGATDEIM